MEQLKQQILQEFEYNFNLQFTQSISKLGINISFAYPDGSIVYYTKGRPEYEDIIKVLKEKKERELIFLSQAITTAYEKGREDAKKEHEILVNTILETKEQEREKLVEEIEKKIKIPSGSPDGIINLTTTEMGYNQALEDVINLIKKGE